jgi:hypothetical protein
LVFKLLLEGKERGVVLDDDEGSDYCFTYKDRLKKLLEKII